MNDSATATVLDRIVTQTVRDLAVRKSRVSVAELHRRIERKPVPIDFESSLKGKTVSLITEFKRASPSRGHFDIDVKPAQVAGEYIAGGCSAMSCLTDGPFFEGSLDDLEIIASAAFEADRPVGVLRKDFIVDRYQVEEARAFGASCILLIVAVLDDASLVALGACAKELGMNALVEVHDEWELERVLAASATLVGINNRNLRTMKVDLDVTERLASEIPSSVTVVAESGISTRADVERMANAGADAILVGASIITQPDRAAAVAALAGVERRGRHRT